MMMQKLNILTYHFNDQKI